MAEVHPVIAVLPDEYTRGIGRVIVQWAFVEWILKTITYDLLKVDPKRGRVAVREPRPGEYIAMYRQLMRLNNIDKKFPLENSLAALPKMLSDRRAERDLIAHSVWAKHSESGVYLIQRMSGNWAPDDSGRKISKREVPEGLVITPDALEGLRAEIERLGSVLMELHQGIIQALALRDK